MSFIKRLSGLLRGERSGSDSVVVSGDERRIVAGFATLRAVAPDIPERISRFVLSGDDAAVLTAIAAAPSRMRDVLYALAPMWNDDRPRAHIDALTSVARDGALEPPQLARLGRALAATADEALAPYTFPGTATSPAWFRILLRVAWGSISFLGPTALAPDARPKPADFGGLSAARCLAILACADPPASPTALFDYLLRDDPAGKLSALTRMPGFAELLRERPADVEAAARELDADACVALCRLLVDAVAVEANLTVLAALATGPAKSAREAAIAALAGVDGDRLRATLAPVFAANAVEPKLAAAGVLTRVLGAAARPDLEALAAAGGSKRLADGIGLQLAALGSEAGVTDGADEATGYVAVDGTRVELATLPPLPADTPFPADLVAEFARAIDGINASERRRPLGPDGDARREPLSSAHLPEIVDGSLGGKHAANAQNNYERVDREMRDEVRRIFADPRVTLWHCLRALPYFQWVRAHPQTAMPPLTAYEDASNLAAVTRARMQTELRDAREIVAMQTVLGRNASDVAAEIFAGVRWDGSDWDEIDPADAPFVWPLFAARLDLFERAFRTPPTDRSRGSRSPSLRALSALALLPKTPQRLLGSLMHIAVTGTREERRRARDLLAAAPGLDSAIAGLLSDGKAETRADAAQWLAERDACAAIPRLRTLLAAERSDRARAAYLKALHRLGDDITPFVGVDTLFAQAKAGLAKTTTKGLEWFPFGQLPTLRWANGAPVDAQVVRWWVVLANKLKEPSGNPLFEVYFDRLNAADVAAFGNAIISIFIAYDTQRPPESEAVAYADAEVAKIGPAFPHGQREAYYRQLKASMSARFVNSAAENRGILALATRADGATAAAALRAFVKTFGGRTSQAKSLVACLAANPSPVALQAAIAVAGRSKQRTLQEFAAATVEAIAEARGWTADELADNTLPTGGLDDDGSLDLDCGPDRVVRAVLLPSGKLELRNSNGKSIKALPDARTPDDDEPLLEAKRAWSSAKKTVAQVIESQTARFYEAMCVGRNWTAPDFERLFARHPIASGLCRRLVWLVLAEDERVVATFRPLDDGTFTDAHDMPVVLDPAARVALAHRALVNAALAAAWQLHLTDYEVRPLFEQFARPIFRVSDGTATVKDEWLTDRRGYAIEHLTLRGAATKRGYVAGPAQDGGVFNSYVRRYHGIGLQAEIGFSGAGPGNDNATVIFGGVSFTRIARSGMRIQLANVPPVLLSETLNDMHDFAALGTGYDAAWEQKAWFR